MVSNSQRFSPLPFLPPPSPCPSFRLPFLSPPHRFPPVLITPTLDPRRFEEDEIDWTHALGALKRARAQLRELDIDGKEGEQDPPAFFDKVRPTGFGDGWNRKTALVVVVMVVLMVVDSVVLAMVVAVMVWVVVMLASVSVGWCWYWQWFMYVAGGVKVEKSGGRRGREDTGKRLAFWFSRRKVGRKKKRAASLS